MKKALLIALFATTLGLMGCQKDDSSAQSDTTSGSAQQQTQSGTSSGATSAPVSGQPAAGQQPSSGQ